jgi:hypothetical protein
MGRVVGPQDTLESVLGRFPSQELETGGTGMEILKDLAGPAALKAVVNPAGLGKYGKSVWEFIQDELPAFARYEQTLKNSPLSIQEIDVEDALGRLSGWAGNPMQPRFLQIAPEVMNKDPKAMIYQGRYISEVDPNAFRKGVVAHELIHSQDYANPRFAGITRTGAPSLQELPTYNYRTYESNLAKELIQDPYRMNSLRQYLENPFMFQTAGQRNLLPWFEARAHLFDNFVDPNPILMSQPGKRARAELMLRDWGLSPEVWLDK